MDRPVQPSLLRDYRRCQTQCLSQANCSHHCCPPACAFAYLEPRRKVTRHPVLFAVTLRLSLRFSLFFVSFNGVLKTTWFLQVPTSRAHSPCIQSHCRYLQHLGRSAILDQILSNFLRQNTWPSRTNLLLALHSHCLCHSCSSSLARGSPVWFQTEVQFQLRLRTTPRSLLSNLSVSAALLALLCPRHCRAS